MAEIPPFSSGDRSLFHKQKRSFVSRKKIVGAFLFMALIGGVLFFAGSGGLAMSKTPLLTNLKSPCLTFTGRERDLRLLHKELVAGLSNKDYQNGTKVKVLWGNGGIGKSELAIEFANRFISQFSLVWTFHCDNQEQIDQGYYRLAEELGIARSTESAEKLKEKVHFQLENHSFGRPWLLIYDNIESEFTDFPQRGGVILVTSQKRVLESEQLLEVQPFSKDESLQLLEKITGEARGESMQHLAEDLGGVPLLLNYAAHYIRTTPGCDVTDYQKLFSTHLLEKVGPLWTVVDTNRGYFKSLAASWQLSLASLEKENPAALDWLFVCSYLYPENIDEAWIDGWLEQRGHTQQVSLEITRKKILQALQNYGLIRYEQTGTFSLHRFLQSILRESRANNMEADLGQTLALLAKYSTKYHLKGAAAWKEAERWYVHACAATRWFSLKEAHFFSRENILHAGVLYLGIAEWCDFNDRYSEALLANERLLNLRKMVLDPDDREVGNAYEAIGWTLYKMDRFAESLANTDISIDIFGRFLKNAPETVRSEKVYKETRLDYALALSSRGLILFEEGKYQESLDCHHEVYRIRLAEFGEEHVYVGRSLHCMAACHYKLKQYSEAMQLCDKASEIYQKTCGREHPWFVWNKQNKAWILFEQGQHQLALKLLRECFDLLVSMRSKDHGDLVYGLNELAACHQRLKNYQEAKKLFKESLKNSLAHHGKYTRAAVPAHRGLAWIYLENNRTRKGLKHLSQELQVGLKIYKDTPRMAEILDDYQKALIEAQKRGAETDQLHYAAL